MTMTIRRLSLAVFRGVLALALVFSAASAVLWSLHQALYRLIGERAARAC